MDLTIKQLQQICKVNGIKGCYGKKTDIIKKLQDNGILIKTGKERKTSPKRRSPGKQKTCPRGKILNESTQRCIKIGGPTYNKLVNEGTITPVTSQKGRQIKKSRSRSLSRKSPARSKREDVEFGNLPYEILHNMALNMNLKTLNNYCKTNSNIHEICKDNFFWKEKFQKDFPSGYSIDCWGWERTYKIWYTFYNIHKDHKGLPYFYIRVYNEKVPRYNDLIFIPPKYYTPSDNPFSIKLNYPSNHNDRYVGLDIEAKSKSFKNVDDARGYSLKNMVFDICNITIVGIDGPMYGPEPVKYKYKDSYEMDEVPIGKYEEFLTKLKEKTGSSWVTEIYDYNNRFSKDPFYGFSRYEEKKFWDFIRNKRDSSFHVLLDIPMFVKYHYNKDELKYMEYHYD